MKSPLNYLNRGPTKGSVRIIFDEPQKAVPTGQVAAIWDDDWCLGCGTIV